MQSGCWVSAVRLAHSWRTATANPLAHAGPHAPTRHVLHLDRAASVQATIRRKLSSEFSFSG
jgi:hypothetical protein